MRVEGDDYLCETNTGIQTYQLCLQRSFHLTPEVTLIEVQIIRE